MSQSATPWIEDPNGPTSGEKNTAMWIHLCMLFNATILPLAGLIGAIVIWRINARKSDFVNRHGWAVGNLIISGVIYAVILVALGFGAAAVADGMSEDTPRSGAAVALITLVAMWGISLLFWLVNIITAIIGAVSASSGRPYRYFHAMPLVAAS